MINAKYDLKENIPTLAIVLAYYKGSKYIKDQINSIFNQSFVNFVLFISNDSKEEKINLKDCNLNSQELSRIKIIERKNSLGCINNFLITLGDIKEPFDYYAMSDQDDIWFKDKILNAIDALKKYTNSTPNLYGSRTEIFNKNCIKKLGTSKLLKKPLSFKNALVENFAGGNTMVFNSTAKDLIVNTSRNLQVAHHDWWSYLIISGVGGNVIYDKRPSLKYRQHGINLTGTNRGIKSKFSRLIKFKKGNYREWNSININALIINESLLKKCNKKTLHFFNKSRNPNLVIRIIFFFRSKVYRQSFLENIVMFFGIIFKLV